MKQLHQNWITEGLLDFEYKKYVLLAYLQHVNENFNNSRLYPFLADLVSHYHNIVAIKEQKQMVANSFPKQLSRLDFQNFKLHYESIIGDEKYMEVIEEIVDYAIPLFKSRLQEGTQLYDFVEEKISFFAVGLVPLYNQEGYLMIKTNPKKDTQVYQYEVTVFQNANEQYRGIKTQYISAYKSNISNTFENIKFDLVKSHKKLPNPATYAIETALEFPIEETVLPIAKRLLVKNVSQDLMN